MNNVVKVKYNDMMYVISMYQVQYISTGKDLCIIHFTGGSELTLRKKYMSKEDWSLVTGEA